MPTYIDRVIDCLGDSDAVLAVDETGDLENGAMTVECRASTPEPPGGSNAQVAVYLAYAGARRHAMIDRELYYSRPGSADDQRRAAAGGHLTSTS